MSRQRIRKGDTVTILTGKDRGKKGKVLQVLTETDKVIVEERNIGVRHVRPKKERQKGQRVQFSMPIHISNVRRADEKKSQKQKVATSERTATAAEKKQKPSESKKKSS